MKITTREDGTEVFESPGVNLLCMDDVDMHATEWIWKGRLPRGKLVLVGGLPSTGKTTLVMSLLAAETSGSNFPLSACTGGRGSVIIMSAEDDPGDTLKPRLHAAGADMSRVFMVTSVSREYDGETQDGSFLLSRDLVQLRQTLRSQQNVSMIVFDPLSAYLGAKDSHRDSDVRQVLGPLCELAADFGVCVIGITHLNKNEGASAMSRFMGSTGIIAAARAGYLAAPYKDAYVLVPVKNNLAPIGTGMTYDIEEVIVKTCNPHIVTSATKWLEEVDVTADEVLAGSQDKQSSPSLIEAQEFLHDLLSDGPKKATEIRTKAKNAGLSFRTIERAKENMKLLSGKDRFSGGWKWFTPEQHEAWKTNKSTELGGLRERENAEEPQQPIYGGLRKKNPLKARPRKGLPEGRQDSENHPNFYDYSASNNPGPPKTAKSGVLGNNERKTLL